MSSTATKMTRSYYVGDPCRSRVWRGIEALAVLLTALGILISHLVFALQVARNSSR